MQQINVSLIIPVYNVEKYLCKCMESAIGQTLKYIEIIIVNDGSTDNCASIIEEYAARDERVKVINQENKGLSAARNTGIMVAKGEYLAFLDSDDWVTPGFLEKMYNTAKEKDADIVICNHTKVVEGVVEFPVKRHFRSDEITSFEALRKVISDTEIKSFAWDKLYKRSLFTQNDISYPQGLYFEDMATTFKLFYYSSKIATIKDCLYYYRQRLGGLSKRPELKRIYDNIKAVEIMGRFLEEKGNFMRYAREYWYLCVKMLICSVFNLTVIHGVTGEPGILKNMRRAIQEISSLMTVKRCVDKPL